MRRYRHLLLLLGALLLPTVAITTMGWQMIKQQRALAETTKQKQKLEWVDAQKRALTEVHRSMTILLDRIKYQESAALATGTGLYSDPAVRLVARIDRDRLVLPWESNPNKDRFRQATQEPEFQKKLAEAERAELVEKRYDGAAALYSQAGQTARNDDQRRYSRFLQSRALWQWGTPEARAKAADIDLDLLKQPSNVVDDFGLPFETYAAGRLAAGRTAEPKILDRLNQDLRAVALAATVSPAGAAEWKRILETMQGSGDPAIRDAAAAASTRLSTRLQELDQAQALQKDFPRIRMAPNEWRIFGEPSWLVGLGSPTGGVTPVIALEASDILRNVESTTHIPGLQFQIVTDGSGDPLGADLPGLGVSFQSTGRAETPADINQSFYALALALVLGLTFLGGYLLWRDTRREVHLSELRSQFVSSVSHELKTPLTAIRMFAETLQMRGYADPEKHARFLGTIVNESERLTRLLNNVLDFSRIERGQKTYHMQPTALAEVVDAVAHAMEYPLAAQGFTLRVHVAEDVPRVNADRDALEQAILNLLTNAMKYSGKSRDIDLRLALQNGSALIQVEDRGIGIPPKDQARIFERFYRVQTPENRGVAGAGLGLALVAHIAQAHGGDVHVKSAPGEGSTFTIEIPLPRAQAGANREVKVAEAHS
jgi:signal transduction histidine kinase